MNDSLCFNLDDPELCSRILAQLGIPSDGHTGRPACALGSIRDILRVHGFVMDIRPASPVSVLRHSHVSALSLLISGGQALLLTSRSSKWTCLTPGGGKRTADPQQALVNLDSDEIESARQRRETTWGDLPISKELASEAEWNLGSRRSDEVAGFIRNASTLIEDPENVVRMALDSPQDLPFDLSPVTDEDLPWVEIRFIRQIRFKHGRSPYRSILDLMRGEVTMITLLLLTAIISMPAGFLFSLLLAHLVDQSRVAIGFPWTLMALLFCVLAYSQGTGLVQTYGAVRLAARIRVRLMNAYLFRVMNSRLEFVRNIGDGDLFTRLADLFTLQSLVMSRALPALITLATMSGGVLYLVIAVPYVVPLLLVGLVLVVLLLLHTTPRLRDLQFKRLKNSSVFRDRLLERLEGRRVLRHFDPDGYLFHRVDPFLARVAEYSQRGVVLGTRLGLLSSLSSLVVVTASIWLVATRFQAGQASLGGLLVVIGLLTATYQGLTNLIGVIPEFIIAEPALRRLREVIEVTEPEPPSEVSTHRESTPVSLEVSHLEFGWRNGRKVLRDISFNISAGEWVSVVGVSGSGKSTLAHVLAGLLAPVSGRLILDGQEIEGYNPAVLRNRISVVTQETFLFNRSIHDNITLGLEAVRPEDIKRVLDQSGMGDFLASQPLGLDQPVGENGLFISVGEKCRIGIARALLRTPGLIVIDEALARVDEETAQDIVDRLRRLGLSALLLTHDLRRARDCSRILVLRDGIIAESGTFKDIVGAGGPFADLYGAKALGYET